MEINWVLRQPGKLESLQFSHHFGSNCSNKLNPPTSSNSRSLSCNFSVGNSVSSATGDNQYDRLKEVKRFDDSKIGVKGLLDSCITSIPRIFHHPPETRPGPRPTTRSSSSSHVVVPVVDLSGDRASVVEQVRKAASTVGFFQITNHGVPEDLLRRAIAAVKGFNELPTSEKMEHYHREMGKAMSFSTNVDLYKSKAASWRDTIQLSTAPNPPAPEGLHETVRSVIFEWDKEIERLAEDLMGLLSEGLGVETNMLKELTCAASRTVAAHYYPYCPQPDLTYGLTSHTDPGVVTVLLQNEVTGLQVKYGEDWVDVVPIPGGIIINIGDILQILSNDEYISVEHRVLANDGEEPRISMAVFCNPSDRENLYGPLPELVSPDKPAQYRQFSLLDYLRRFFNKELDGKTLTNYYRVSESQ